VIIRGVLLRFLEKVGLLEVKPRLILDDMGILLNVEYAFDFKRLYRVCGVKFRIPKDTFLLLLSREIVKLPPFLSGLVLLRSRWAREGLLMPPTKVDSGFRGKLVFEVYACRECIIDFNQPFAQLTLSLAMPPWRYEGVYQHQGAFRLSVYKFLEENY